MQGFDAGAVVLVPTGKNGDPRTGVEAAPGASLGLPETFEMSGMGAEVFCGSFRAAPDASNQVGLFGQFVSRARLAGLFEIGLQSFADERRLGLALHARAVAQALSKRLRNADGDAVGGHVQTV